MVEYGRWVEASPQNIAIGLGFFRTNHGMWREKEALRYLLTHEQEWDPLLNLSWACLFYILACACFRCDSEKQTVPLANLQVLFYWERRCCVVDWIRACRWVLIPSHEMCPFEICTLRVQSLLQTQNCSERKWSSLVRLYFMLLYPMCQLVIIFVQDIFAT